MILLTMRLGAIAVASAASSPPFAAGARNLGGGEDLGISLGRIILALVICLAVALLAILLIRQRMGKSDLSAWLSSIQARERHIEVVETRRLSQHADICLVRHRQQEYLLLLMASGAQILCQSEISPQQSAGEA